MTSGIYIHVPFCRSKCDYCGFYSIPVGRSDVVAEIPDSFVRGLSREIASRARDCGIERADTVYFGGGTPSLLSVGQVAEILAQLRSLVELGPGTEITLEMNPADVARDALSGFVDAGVNRIVLGVQTLSERLHRLIGRSCEPCTVPVLKTFFAASGITHCVDVITGIPSQTAAELRHDIGVIAGFRPSHISAYLLSVEKNTPLSLRYAPSEYETEQACMFELTAELLAERGYERYEISNYALPGCESRHNMKYWRYEPYIGFGPGAHSFIGNERYINTMTVEEYFHAERVVLQHDVRTSRSAAVEYILTGLRLLRGMSIREMEERLVFHLPDSVLDRISKAESDGLVAVTANDGDRTIRLTSKGIMIADRVIYGIVEPLL
jgi:oxygen-independent coproporphyrinogen-3 oxidase